MDTLIASFQTLVVDPAAPKFIYVQPQQQQQQQQFSDWRSLTPQQQQPPLQQTNTLCNWIGCNHGTAMDVDDVFCPRRSERLAIKAPVNYKGMCK